MEWMVDGEFRIYDGRPWNEIKPVMMSVPVVRGTNHCALILAARILSAAAGAHVLLNYPGSSIRYTVDRDGQLATERMEFSGGGATLPTMSGSGGLPPMGQEA